VGYAFFKDDVIVGFEEYRFLRERPFRLHAGIAQDFGQVAGSASPSTAIEAKPAASAH